MKFELFRQRDPDKISRGDGINIEHLGECMVIDILDAETCVFAVMSIDGAVASIKYHPEGVPAMEWLAPTTLQ